MSGYFFIILVANNVFRVDVLAITPIVILSTKWSVRANGGGSECPIIWRRFRPLFSFRTINQTSIPILQQGTSHIQHFLEWMSRLFFLDEKALAACLAYVDLNPVRAGIAKTPEESDYTSIADRSVSIQQNAHGGNKAPKQPDHLLSFVGNPRADTPKGLPFRLADYLELLDWSGRAVLENKRGAILQDQPPILERLQIDPKHWLYMTQHFESKFKGLVGAGYSLKAACQELGYRRTPNLTVCQQLLT